jgi:hypothetical protein
MQLNGGVFEATMLRVFIEANMKSSAQPRGLMQLPLPQTGGLQRLHKRYAFYREPYIKHYCTIATALSATTLEPFSARLLRYARIRRREESRMLTGRS